MQLKGEKYHRDKQKLCPYPLKTIVEKANFHESK